jgi:hypothetical protein
MAKKKRSTLEVWMLLAVLSFSATAGEVSPVGIEVLPDGQHCTMEFSRAKMPCDLLPEYLHRTLNIDSHRAFCVFVDGVEKVDPRALRVAEMLQHAGYARANTCLHKSYKEGKDNSLQDRTPYINVLSGGFTCVVLNTGTSAPCEKIVDHVIKTLHISKTEYVGITTEGCSAVVVAKARAVAEALRQSGFTLVREIGIPEPNMSCIP